MINYIFFRYHLLNTSDTDEVCMTFLKVQKTKEKVIKLLIGKMCLHDFTVLLIIKKKFTLQKRGKSLKLNQQHSLASRQFVWNNIAQYL